MKWLEDSFDVVIIDSPPLQLVSDPLILSQFANSVIYVVKADSTPYQVAARRAWRGWVKPTPMSWA
jgi:succinoglycan biosynthesis transport protein ExoP